MALTIQELRESGLLELYVLGRLSESDQAIVEDGIRSFPELKEDLKDIEKALHYYAEANAIPAPASGLTNLINQINKDTASGNSLNTAPKGNNSMNWLLWVLGVATLGLLILTYFQADRLNKLSDSYKTLQEDCETKEAESEKTATLYAALTNINNELIEVNATDKYPDTKLILYSNEVDKKNYIQVQSLPPLNSDQSFQLWSLKGTDAPIPLDVFRSDQGVVFEVLHEEGSDAYAITIEPLGGSQSPTMENLIGVFGLS